MDAFSATIEIPQLGELLREDASRTHNKIVKSAMRATLLLHHERHIPRHFQRSAHRRYGYAERSPRYRHFKQRKYRSSIDLVMSGRTRSKMTSQIDQLTVGGNPAGGTLRGDLVMSFPFTGAAQQAHARRARGQSKGAPLSARARKDGKPRVTIAQMRKEVAAISGDEVQTINQELRRRYVDLVKFATGARQRITI